MSEQERDNAHDVDAVYDAKYYTNYFSPSDALPYDRSEPHWGRFFGEIAGEIIRSLQPSRVFDAGCAHGFLVEALWDRGVEARGRDISHFAVSQVRDDLRSFVAQGSITDPIDGEYDLITCIEVLEHLEEQDAITAVSRIAAASPRVLFSSSPDEFDEPTHINVKPVIWWLQRFAEAGMAPVPTYDASFLTQWAFLLERSDRGRSPRELQAFAELIRMRMLTHEQSLQIGAARHAVEQARQHEAATTAILAATVAENARLRASQVNIQPDIVVPVKQGFSVRCWDACRANPILRRAWAGTPESVRHTVRRSLRVSYWLATGQFGRRMAARRAFRSQQAARTAPSEPDYSSWIREHDTITDLDRDAIRAHIARFANRPLISVVMPAYETAEPFLRQAIQSVQNQIYRNWELCIADDASPSDTVSRVVQDIAKSEPRIKFIRRDANGHIAAATNSAIALSVGEFIALMDHDDLLPEHALYELAAALDAHPNTDMLYSDQDLVDSAGNRHEPYFKPDWSPYLMLGHNVFSHLGVIRKTLLDRVDNFRVGVVDGSQDYDLVLRCMAVTDPARIRHVPAILYHWRRPDTESSFSQQNLERCVTASRRAIVDYQHTQGVDVKVEPVPKIEIWNRIVWPMPDPAPKVSIVVPTRDRAELLARCVSGLLHRTGYPNLELLIVDNESSDPDTLALLSRLENDRRVRVLPFPGPFNYSAINNAAVPETTGDIVVLMNNDTDVIDGGWLREMVSIAVKPDVGAVGAKLLFPDGKIQHAGIVLGVGSHRGGPGIAGHFGYLAENTDLGCFGQFVLARDVSAVTAACMAMRREVFFAAGGFDATDLAVAYNDVDLCLRIRALGLRIVWTPFAELYHLESASRGPNVTPEKIEREEHAGDVMRKRWGPLLDTDPFYNPNFSKIDHTFKFSFPPRRRQPWRV